MRLFGWQKTLLSARMDGEFYPGLRVHHPSHPEWGAGQVQSVVGVRVTVNFEHVGKVVVHTDIVPLVPEEPERR